MTISETVTLGMSSCFADDLAGCEVLGSVCRAISLSLGREFQGFTAMLYAEGYSRTNIGRRVSAHVAGADSSRRGGWKLPGRRSPDDPLLLVLVVGQS